MARHGFVARRVHVHVVALALGDVAGRIGGAEYFLGRAALARDLDQADAHADVEDLVLPHEAVVVDLADHVVGDLPRFLQRAADQQQAELVAAETSDGVGVADRFLDERGDLAQHAVAGHVSAAVVDDLEAIEVEVAQHVARFVGVRQLERFFQPALELAPIDQAGERVVARLVRHLARDAAQLAYVAHDDDGADQLALLRAQRRDRQLDRALLAAAARDHQAAPPDRDLRLRRQAMPHRVAERTAVAFVEQRDDVGDALADRIDGADADQLLADLVHVVDACADVGGDHAFAERVECFPRRRAGARGRRYGGSARPHFDEVEQQRRTALVIDAHSRQLGARRLAGLRMQLDFQTLQPGLAGERAAQMLAHQVGVIGMHELRERVAFESA